MKLEKHNEKEVKTFRPAINVDSSRTVNKSPMFDDNLTSWRDEILAYLKNMSELSEHDEEQIFVNLAGWSARASYIRSYLILDSSRSYQAFRTGIVDPFIQECDRQFKVWSRYASIKQMQWEMESKA